MIRKLLLVTLSFLCSLGVSQAQQPLHRPNIEVAQRALQERYIRWIQAAKAMELSGADSLPEYLVFPPRVKDGRKPGLYPEDCFYEEDIFDPDSGQLNDQPIGDLVVDLLQHMADIDSYIPDDPDTTRIESWGDYWVHPAWQSGLAGRDATSGKIAIIDTFKNIGYPSVTSDNLMTVFGTIVGILEQMAVMRFQVLTDTSVATLPSLKEGVGLGIDNDANCSAVKSITMGDFNGATPEPQSHASGIVPLGRQQWVYYIEDGQTMEQTWFAGISAVEHSWSFDYTTLASMGGSIEIYGRIKAAPDSTVDVESYLSTDNAPHNKLNEWFEVDSFPISSSGIYTSALYADHASSNFVIGCPGTPDSENRIELGWFLYAAAIVRPQLRYFPSQALIACSEGCGVCQGAGGTCSNVEFGSLNFSMGLGSSDNGNVGNLEIYTEAFRPNLGTPDGLSINVESPVEIIHDVDADNSLRQILTDQLLVDLKVDPLNPDFNYTIRYYHATDKGQKTGLYYSPDLLDAFKVVSIENLHDPDYSTFATVDMASSLTDLTSVGHGFPVGDAFWAFLDTDAPQMPEFQFSGLIDRGASYLVYALDEDTLSLLHWYDGDYQNDPGFYLDTLVDSDESYPLEVVSGGELRITETIGENSRILAYSSDVVEPNRSKRQIIVDKTVTLTDSHDGKFRTLEKGLIYTALDHYSELRTERDGSGNIIRRTKTDYQVYPWNNPRSQLRPQQAEVVSMIEDPDGDALTTTYSYYGTWPDDGDNWGRLKSVQHPGGSWVAYEYDSDFNVDRIIRPWKNSALSFVDAGNHVTTYARSAVGDLDGDSEDETLRTIIEKIDSSEVARRYELNYSDTSTTLSREAIIEATVPEASWDAQSNQRTDRWTYFDGEFNGDLAKIKNPDGTMRIYVYSIDPTSGERTTTEKEGDPNTTEDDIVDGLETVTVVSTLGGQVSRTVTDILSGIVLSQETTVTFDDLGRPTLISYLDGTSEGFLYEDCCGNVTVTDRTGLVRTTNKDMDGTVASVVSNGITTSYSEGYDSDASDGITGFTKTTTVEGRGTSGSIITRIDTFVPSGELIASIDPRDSVTRTTAFSEAVNASGQLEKSTTLPNTAVQKNVYHKDGSPYQEYFDGVLVRQYDYSVASDTHDGATFNARTETLTRLGPNGETTEWVKTYTDMLGRVYKVETPDMDNSGTNGFALTYFNSLGQREKQVDPDGLNTLFKYNDKGELEEVALSDDDVVDYSGTDRITRTTRSVVNDPTNGEVIRETVSVWEDGQSTGTVIQTTDTSTDGLDIWTNRYGQLTHLGRTYNGSGSVTDVETKPDLTTATTTTVNGFRTGYTVSHPTEGTLVDFSYVPDDFDRLHTETNDLLSDPGNEYFVTTTYSYWDTGALKQVITPESATSAGDAQTTTYDYDVMGQVIEVTLPRNKVQSSRYHPDGNLRLTFGQGTYPVEYTYDRQGRMKTMKTWQDFNTAMETGISGSALTTWNYNALGLLEKKLDNDSKGVVYNYTDTGRLASREWARIGQDGNNPLKTVYTYGTTGSEKADLLNIDYQNDGDAMQDITYTYDRLGRTKDVFDASGKRTLSYEDGVLVDETYGDDGDPGTEDPFLGMVIDRRQDSYNRLDQVRVLDSQSAQLYKAEYGYDDASRLETTIFGANSVTYSYNPAATTRQTLTYANGTGYVMTVSRNFDNMDRQTVQTSAITGGGTHSYTYTYNDLNQRTHMTLASGEYWQYGYDGLGHVNAAVKKTPTDAAIPGYSYSFTLDDIGNRENTTVNGRFAEYTANLLNQYTGREVPRVVDIRGSAHAEADIFVNGNSLPERPGEYFYYGLLLAGDNDAQLVDYLVTGNLEGGGYEDSDRIADLEGEEFLKAHPETFDHDDDGNLLYDGKWDYTWNAENRLIKVITKASVAAAGAPNLRLEFAYDSQGRRFQKDVYEHDGNDYVLKETRYFLYDGWNPVAELDADLDLLNTYVWGTDLSGSFQGAGGVGGLLFTSNSWTGVTASPWYDGNGNILGYVDVADNSVVAEFEYGAFGELIRSTGPMAEFLAFGFSTKYLDAETGLLYYGYRYYSSEWGRWLSRDSLGEEAGLSLYGFVGNDGVNYIDDLGQRKREVHKVPPENRRIPVKPAPKHLQPKLPGVYGSGTPGTVGGLNAIGAIFEFSNLLSETAALADIMSLAGAFPKLCKFEREVHSNRAPKGCGCCVLIITARLNELGNPLQVIRYDLSYVPISCDKTKRGGIPFQLLDADYSEMAPAKIKI